MSPQPAVSPLFGPLRGPWQVESAAVTSLQKWMSTYLEEVQRQNGLALGVLQKPSLVYGAGDETAWDQSTVPAVIVVCEAPEHEPERYSDSGYTVAYRVTTYAVLQSENEDLARRDAGLYAVALMGVMTQEFAGDNLGLVSDVMMLAAPSVHLQDPDIRLVYTGQCAFDVSISPLVIDTNGPDSPLTPGQTPPLRPTVLTTNPTIVTKPLPT